MHGAKQRVDQFARSATIACGLPQFLDEGGDLLDSILKFHALSSTDHTLIVVFRFGTDILLWLLFVEVAFDGVKNAVDELGCFVG